MKTQSLFFSHNRQWALFRGAVRGILTKPLFQKTKRSAFRTWGQGESRLLLHLEEPTISIQPAFLPYPLAFVCFRSLFFFPPPCGRQVAQVRLLEKILIPVVFFVRPSAMLTSWTFILPNLTWMCTIKEPPYQHTWASDILAGLTSCWSLASVAGTAGEWSRLTH